MPNIKSAERRVRKSESNREENQEVKVAMRTSIKKFNALVEEGDVANAKDAYTTAFKRIDKAVKKGVVQKNKAAREKSRLSKQLNELTA
ncbi:30S ribosomal protein S20 [Tuberibacillus sp. Marseille-P3662]|uniref:30S ribosomal protein S20 n=1 Tax=Tuberibacillus sp. Marseille-P3662 TaxID=1965358 RepID=UPI000A1CC958|nr:30S ribosomal protein S20 [Tuberibacillus sp. Marseille-P3662]